jgi:hypothetical protein
MARKKFTPGAFIRIPLTDGSYAYGRLREFPFVTFYNFRTDEPVSDLNEIASKPILFTLAVHKSVLNSWEIIGQKPLEEHMNVPIKLFKQDIADYTKCQILDTDGNKRPAEPEECIGLERDAVWEANHVEDRLLDTFLNRPNKWVESLKVKFRK